MPIHRDPTDYRGRARDKAWELSRPRPTTIINRYPGACAVCGGRVPARGGHLVRPGGTWKPIHLACHETGKPEVTEIRTSGGSWIQNRRGRCEDAPCCGCCTF